MQILPTALDAVNNLLFFGFFLITLVLIGPINASANFNNTMIIDSIGLLTFIAVFYSFVLRKEFSKKADEVSTSFWRKNSQSVLKLLKDVKTQIDKDPKDYIKLSKTAIKFSDSLENVSLVQRSTQIELKLLKSTILFLLAILLLFIDSVSSISILYNYPIFIVRDLGFVSFLFGTYYVFGIVVSWFVVIFWKK